MHGSFACFRPAARDERLHSKTALRDDSSCRDRMTPVHEAWLQAGELPISCSCAVCPKHPHPSSFRSQVYRRGIRLLTAAKQQIPRATMPCFGMRILWGFSNYTTTKFPRPGSVAFSMVYNWGEFYASVGGIYETHPRKTGWAQERFERTWGHCRGRHGPTRLITEVAGQGKRRRSGRCHDGRIQDPGDRGAYAPRQRHPARSRVGPARFQAAGPERRVTVGLREERF